MRITWHNPQRLQACNIWNALKFRLPSPLSPGPVLGVADLSCAACLVVGLALPELPHEQHWESRGSLIESLLLRKIVLGTNHKNNSFTGLASVILQWGAWNVSGSLTSEPINDLLYPLLQAEDVCVEAVFSIPVTAFTPWDDAHLIPAVVIGALRKKHGVSNRVKSKVGSSNCSWKFRSLPVRPEGSTHQLRAFWGTYLHDKGSPAVALTGIPSFAFTRLVTLRENHGAQGEASSRSSHSPLQRSCGWVPTGCFQPSWLRVASPHTAKPRQILSALSSMYSPSPATPHHFCTRPITYHSPPNCCFLSLSFRCLQSRLHLTGQMTYKTRQTDR